MGSTVDWHGWFSPNVDVEGETLTVETLNAAVEKARNAPYPEPDLIIVDPVTYKVMTMLQDDKLKSVFEAGWLARTKQKSQRLESAWFAYCCRVARDEYERELEARKLQNATEEQKDLVKSELEKGLFWSGVGPAGPSIADYLKSDEETS